MNNVKQGLNAISYEKGKDNEYIRDLKTFYYDQFDIMKQSVPSSGIYACYRLSRLAEETLIKVYEDIRVAYGYDEKIAALVAVGGFGRQELNPYSDIDILFLQHKKYEKESSEFITKVLYILWDMKFRLGQSSRTVKNCIKAATEDITFKTSITNHRFLCGNEILYDKFVSVIPEIFSKNLYSYYHVLAGEPDFSLFDLGKSVLIKEPDVKESQGGLRSVHKVLWLTKAFFGCSTLKELYNDGFMDRKEYRSINKSFDYLLYVRNLLHFLDNRKQDVLKVEQQEKLIMNFFKLVNEKNLRKTVETFMRNFYKHSKNIYLWAISSIEKIKSEAEKLKVLPRKKKIEPLDKDFIIIDGNLYLRHKKSDNPELLFKIFTITSKYTVGYSNEIRECISRCLKYVNDDFRRNEKNFEAFRNILRKPRNLYYTLSMMHATGFLKEYLPYWKAMDCHVQHDFYHEYTLDEHHLQSVKQLELLYKNESSYLTFYRNILYLLKNREILVFSLLMHDYGKIWQGDHVENARRTMDNVVEVFPFTEDEKIMIAFLIQNHLLMSRTSQRVDFNEMKTLASFADKVVDEQRLRNLLIFTYADMNGVGHGIFNNWKSSLLLELYYKTHVLLKDMASVKLLDNEIEDIKKKLLVKSKDKSGLSNFLTLLPENYYIEIEQKDILRHFELYKNKNGKKIILDYKQKHDYYLVFAIAEEKIGLFSIIAGIFAANGLSILDASLYTKNIAVDYFVISHYFEGPVEKNKWERVEKELNKALNGEMEDISGLIKKRMSKTGIKSNIQVKTKIEFDNSPEGMTILRISCRDSIGLLYKISSIISQLDFDIQLAKINTLGIRVVDTFYILNSKRKLLTNQERDELLKILTQKLS